MTNSMFRALIYGKFRTAADLAGQLNWGKQKLNRIMNGIQYPTVMEIQELATALSITNHEAFDLFVEQ